MLRDLVVNKDLSQQPARSKDLPRYSSMDSDVSEGSTLVSTGSDLLEPERRRKRINHHSIRATVSDTEAELAAVSTLPYTSMAGCCQQPCFLQGCSLLVHLPYSCILRNGFFKLIIITTGTCPRQCVVVFLGE